LTGGALAPLKDIVKVGEVLSNVLFGEVLMRVFAKPAFFFPFRSTPFQRRARCGEHFQDGGDPIHLEFF
jgi:hypothetical protein